MSSEHITNLLNPLKGKAFQEISTMSFVNMPIVEIPEEEVPNDSWLEAVIEGGMIENLPLEALPEEPEPHKYQIELDGFVYRCGSRS